MSQELMMRRLAMAVIDSRSVCWTCVYMALVGLVLLVLGLATVGDADTSGAVLFVLGGGALITATFVSRLEGTFRIGPLQLTLREQVMKATRAADERTLAGILPLLTSEDVSITTLALPGRFEGLSLIDEGLAFLRKQLNVSVIGVLPNGQERWVAGGAVSELQLHEADQILVAGHPDTLSYLRYLVAVDKDELWQRAI
jgi:hypothetical protein